MKGNKIFDFSRKGFQDIINIMTRKINEVVDLYDKTIFTKSCTSELRPTRNLYVGLQVFDTTLGKPIWCKSIDGIWVNSNGEEV